MPGKELQAESIVILVICMAFGIPINVWSFLKIVHAHWMQGKNRYRKSSRINRDIKKANGSLVHLLQGQLNLCLCELLRLNIKGIHASICKTSMFLIVLAFQGASMSVTCIALDRLFCCLSLQALVSTGRRRFVYSCIVFSWLLTLAHASPGFVLYDVYVHRNTSFCLPIFVIQRNFTAPQLYVEELYYKLHQSLIFFLPACTIILCYIVIISSLCYRSRKSMLSVKSLKPKKTKESIRTHFNLLVKSKRDEASIKRRNRLRTVSLSAALLTLAFMLCWTPNNLVTILQIRHGHVFNLHYLVVVNSVINPFLNRYIDVNILHLIRTCLKVFVRSGDHSVFESTQYERTSVAVVKRRSMSNASTANEQLFELSQRSVLNSPTKSMRSDSRSDIVLIHESSALQMSPLHPSSIVADQLPQPPLSPRAARKGPHTISQHNATVQHITDCEVPSTANPITISHSNATCVLSPKRMHIGAVNFQFVVTAPDGFETAV